MNNSPITPNTAGTASVETAKHRRRKARNIMANGHAAITMPFRRLPAGPPFSIHFQASAEVVAMNDPQVLDLVADGKLPSTSGHGALDAPDNNGSGQLESLSAGSRS